MEILLGMMKMVANEYCNKDQNFQQSEFSISEAQGEFRVSLKPPGFWQVPSPCPSLFDYDCSGQSREDREAVGPAGSTGESAPALPMSIGSA